MVVSGSEGVQIYSLEGTDTAYRSLIEEMNQGAAILMNDGTVFYCNNRLADMVKVSLGDLIGSSLDNFVSPTDLNLYYALLQKSLKSHSNTEISLQASDGTKIPVYVSSQSLKIKEVEGISLNITDLSEQKRNEMIIKSERLSRCIFEQAGESIIVCDAEGVITRASNVASKFFEVNPILKYFNEVFNLYDEDMNIFSIESVLNGNVIDQMELNSYKKDGSKSYSLLSARPLQDEKNKLVGCVIVLTDITERKKAEHELSKQAALIDISYEAIISLDNNNKILSWNKGAELLYGYNKEEAIGKVSHYLLKTEFPKDFNEIMEILADEMFWIGELTHTTKDGKKVIVDSQMQIIKDISGKKVVIEANRDVTRRKKAEEAQKHLLNEIEKEKDRLSSLVNSIPDEVWFADTDKKFTLANRAALQEFKMKSADRDVEEMAEDIEIFNIDGSHRRVDDAPPLKALKGEVVRNHEELIRNPVSGELRCRVVNAAPVRDAEDNIIGSVSVVHDITERKKLEKELKESEERYRLILETANSGVFLLDPENNIKYINQRMVEILGFSAQDMLDQNLIQFLDIKGQESIPKFMEDWRKGKRRVNEFKFLRKDAEAIWVLLAASPITDVKGRYVGVIGVIMDITARKSLESVLIDRERISKNILYDMMGMINKLMQEESKKEYSEFLEDKHDFT